MPPQIDRDGVELNPRIPIGRTLTLFCDGKGDPTPTVTWSINGTSIESSSEVRILGEKHRFIQIPNITLDDRGVYRCEARNVAGEDELLYKVDVLRKTFSKLNF